MTATGVSADNQPGVPRTTEMIGWIAFTLLVAGVWKLRQQLDRWDRKS